MIEIKPTPEMMKHNNLIYVCSPYKADTKEQLERNIEYARYLTKVALNNKFVPITTHLYLTQVTDESIPEEREKGMAAGMEILQHCKYILVGDKYKISEGMEAEMKAAAVEGLIFLYEESGNICIFPTHKGGKKND